MSFIEFIDVSDLGSKQSSSIAEEEGSEEEIKQEDICISHCSLISSIVSSFGSSISESDIIIPGGDTHETNHIELAQNSRGFTTAIQQPNVRKSPSIGEEPIPLDEFRASMESLAKSLVEKDNGAVLVAATESITSTLEEEDFFYEQDSFEDAPDDEIEEDIIEEEELLENMKTEMEKRFFSWTKLKFASTGSKNGEKYGPLRAFSSHVDDNVLRVLQKRLKKQNDFKVNVSNVEEKSILGTSKIINKLKFNNVLSRLENSKMIKLPGLAHQDFLRTESRLQSNYLQNKLTRIETQKNQRPHNKPRSYIEMIGELSNELPKYSDDAQLVWNRLLPNKKREKIIKKRSSERIENQGTISRLQLLESRMLRNRFDNRFNKEGSPNPANASTRVDER